MAFAGYRWERDANFLHCHHQRGALWSPGQGLQVVQVAPWPSPFTEVIHTSSILSWSSRESYPTHKGRERRTPGLSCCRKRERRRSERCKQSAARLGSAGGVPRVTSGMRPRLNADTVVGSLRYRPHPHDKPRPTPIGSPRPPRRGCVGESSAPEPGLS